MAGAQAARYGLQFAVLPVLARLLGPSAYGLVGLAMPFIFLCNMVADMGLGNALVRTPNPSPVLESTVFWLCEAACVALVGAVCLLAWPAAKLFTAPGLPLIVIALSPILVLGGALSVPNAHLVRAFNSYGFDVFEDPALGGTQADLFYAGPDGEPRERVEKLIEDAGLRPIWIGAGVESAEVVDGVLRLWFTLSRRRGRRIAFKLISD